MTKYHIFKSVLLISFVLLLLSIQSLQSQNTEQQTILGSWLFNSNLSFAQMDQKINEKLTKKPQLRTKILSAYTGKQITFFNNGDYAQVLSSGKKASGRWKVQGNMLVITNLTGTRYNYRYRFQGNMLVISSVSESPNSSSIMPKQYFTKI